MDKRWSCLLCFAVVHCHYCIGLLGFTCCPITISIIVLGYVQKNPPNGWDGWGLRMICFSENTLWDFVTLTCTLKNSEESKLSPLGNSAEEKCVKPVGNSKVRNQDLWKFHISFFWTLREMSTCFSFNTPWKFHGLKPPVFFWNSNIPAIMFVRYTLLKKNSPLLLLSDNQAEMPWKCLLRKQSLLCATIRRN